MLAGMAEVGKLGALGMSRTSGMSGHLGRRSLLRAFGATTVLAAFGGTAPLDRSRPRPVRFPSDPFTLGVASGDPTASGVVLWTRLAPEPLRADGGLAGAGNVPVRWEVAEDPAMRRVVRRGTAVAPADLAHSVHVEVEGLRPGREHWYRFRAGDAVTAPARTCTAPGRHDRVDDVRFAFLTCQKWEDGFYTAYRHLAEEDLDLVLHLGDYTYEYGIDPATGGVRGVTLPAEYADETWTLDQYRLRHSLYKTDADLQAAHARFPFAVTWDDHEVDNDYTDDVPEDGTPPEEFVVRRAAAYQAFYEHLPLRPPARPRGRRGGTRLYRNLPWGRLAQFLVLDTRQFRSDHPCGDGEHARCEASFDPTQTVLGRRQERWLADQLGRSQAQWNLLAQQVLVAQLDHDPGPGTVHWQDAWDGYPAARQRLLDDVLASGARNPFAMTGDWHSTFVNEVRYDPADVTSPVVLPEIVTPAVTSNGDGDVYGPYYGPMIPFNPHIRWFDGDRKGYVRARATRRRLVADVRFVDRVGAPTAGISTATTVTVEDGNPTVHLS
jgi:alkaline phosphatase D